MAENNHPYKKSMDFGWDLLSLCSSLCAPVRAQAWKQSHGEYYGSEGIIIGIWLQTMWEEWRKLKSERGGQWIRKRCTKQTSGSPGTGGQARVLQEIWEAKHTWIFIQDRRQKAMVGSMEAAAFGSFCFCGVYPSVCLWVRHCIWPAREQKVASGHHWVQSQLSFKRNDCFFNLSSESHASTTFGQL